MGERDGTGESGSARPTGLFGEGLEKRHDLAWAEVAQPKVAEPGTLLLHPS